MGRAIVMLSGSAAESLNRPFPSFAGAVARFWRERAARLFHRYRPERHYMRGPGPACRAKYGDEPGRPQG